MSQRRVLVYTDTSTLSATFQIRIAALMQNAGIEVIHVDDLKSNQLSDVVRSEVDAVVIHRGMRKRCGIYEVLREAVRNFGKPLIYDVDDLLIHVPRTHPHYSVYQSRAMRALKTLVDADLVVASTPVLAGYLRHFHSHVLAIPNQLPEFLWRDTCRRSVPQRPSMPQDSVISLGYVGTATHLPDLESIQGALTTVLERFRGRARFVAVGMPLPRGLALHPAVAHVVPPRAVRKSYAAFTAYVARLSIDVGIAPLTDTPFNRCKSDIKFQEYAALGIPGVFSDLPPYRHAIVDRCSGYLAHDMRDWIEMLSRLIESSDIRHQVATASMANLRGRWESTEFADAWNRALDRAVELVQASTHQAKRDVVSAVVDDLFSYQNDLQRQLERTVGYRVTKTIRRMGRRAA